MDCESIDLYRIDYLGSNSCNQEICRTKTYKYVVTLSGKKIETIVNYPNRRAIHSSSGEYERKNFKKI
jgi:hypothetical protein